MSRVRLLGGAVLAAAMAITGHAVAQTVTNYAGVGLGDGRVATDASLVQIRSVAFDPAGHMYLVDASQWRVRKVDKNTGIITTFAGVSTINANGADGDGGAATAASLNAPFDIAFDSSGNAFVSDRGNHRIRRIDASTGTITTFAGTGVAGFSGDGGPAAGAQLNLPAGLVIDAGGNLLVADTSNHRIRRIDAATGVITTLAGTGTAGFTGDGAAAASAQLSSPTVLTRDAVGNIYFIDSASTRVRKITVATGVVDSVAGNGTVAYSGDGGAATLAGLFAVNGIAVDTAGNLFLTERSGHRIRRVDAITGIIATFAGDGTPGFAGDGAPASTAQMMQPLGITFSAANHLYFSDSFNHRVRRIDGVTNEVTTIAGAGVNDGRPASVTALINPAGLSRSPSGNLVVTDLFNARVRSVDKTSRVVSTLAGIGLLGSTGDSAPATAARINGPIETRYDATGNLYIVDVRAHVIRKVDAVTGIITTWAGTGVAGYSGDGGLASAAAFNRPDGLLIDGAGHFIVFDGGNNVIRRIDKDTLVVTTIAGTGIAGNTGDGGPATAAQLDGPGLGTYDSQGNLYFAVNNSQVRRIDAATGTITTVAGNGSAGFSGDGGLATQASFNATGGVAVDSQGNLYVADLFNGRIRRVNASTGKVVTVFGNGDRLATGNNVISTSATGEPQFLMLDGDATLYFSDTRNNLVRRIDNVNVPILVPQVVSFAPLANRAYGSGTFTLAASASSSLAVTFTSLTPFVCTVSGATVTIVSAGTCTIRASQPGDATWSSASQVTQSFTVSGLFRAYLSKNGADTNPCTLAAPCRLLPAALAAVNPGGEVWMLDSANFNAGPVNIAKSVTILAIPGALGSIVANGADALGIIGSDTAEITLRNLVILNLAGTANTGVIFAQGAQLTMEGCEIYGMASGVLALAPGALVNVKETTIRDNVFTGIAVQGNVIAVLDGVDLVNTGTGLAVAAGAQVHVRGGSVSGNTRGFSLSSIGTNTPSSLVLTETVVSGNNLGLVMEANLNTQVAHVVLADTTFTGNAMAVLANLGTLNVFTRANNAFRFNGTDFSGVSPQVQGAQ